MSILILLNVAFSLLAFGAVAAGLVIARHLGPGPQDRWDHAYRRRPGRRPSLGATRVATRTGPRRLDLLGLR
jgi:hypothetical protein